MKLPLLQPRLCLDPDVKASSLHRFAYIMIQLQLSIRIFDVCHVNLIDENENILISQVLEIGFKVP